MTNTSDLGALEAVPADQLTNVLGGGIGSTIGGLFGAKGAKWGGLADQIFGMFKGGGGGGGSDGGGGGGIGGILGKLFQGFGGGGSSAPSGGADPSAAAAPSGGGDQ